MTRYAAKDEARGVETRSIRRRTGPMLWMAVLVIMGHSCCVVSGFAPANGVSRASWRTNQATPSSSLSSNDSRLTEKKLALSMSSEAKDPNEGPPPDDSDKVSTTEKRGWVEELLETSAFFQPFRPKEERKMPPILVEDSPLLLYDIMLIINLTASISFWVVHRMSFDYIAPALSEGSLMCILWIIAGLFNGAFLNSAVDGHYNPTDDRAGPKAAGMLGLHTFINTASMRVILALVTAVVEHRQVGAVPGEDLVPLEIAFGLALMSLWRLLHSSYTVR